MPICLFKCCISNLLLWSSWVASANIYFCFWRLLDLICASSSICFARNSSELIFFCSLSYVTLNWSISSSSSRLRWSFFYVSIWLPFSAFTKSLSTFLMRSSLEVTISSIRASEWLLVIKKSHSTQHGYISGSVLDSLLLTVQSEHIVFAHLRQWCLRCVKLNF